MRALPLVLLALLASGAVATPPGWDQLQGGPERAGVADLQDAPLDVLGWYSVVGPGERLRGGPRIVQTPGGFVGFASGDDGCALVTIPDPVTNASTRRDLGACAGGVLAYDPARGLLFACGRGAAAGTVLEAWDPGEGALRWALRAEALAATVPDAPDLTWQCGAGALDVGEGALYMPFSGARGVGPDEGFAAQEAHRIAKLDAATGQVVWRTEVPEWVFRGGAPGPNVPDALPDPFAMSGRAGFSVFGLTLTQTGLVVTGFRPAPARRAWTTRASRLKAPRPGSRAKATCGGARWREATTSLDRRGWARHGTLRTGRPRKAPSLPSVWVETSSS